MPNPNQNPSSERAPLLGGHDGPADVNGTDAPSKSQRAHDWLSKNVLTIILGLLLVFFIALFLVVFLVQLPDILPGAGDEADVCTSAGCVLAASTILKSISTRKELDPCDDFRTFVCEGFDAVHEIREDQTSVGTLNIMSEEGELILKRVLESPAPKDTSLFWSSSSPDEAIFAKMQDSYNACLNETHLRTVGSKPLIDLLVELGNIYPEKKPKGNDTSLTDAVQFLMGIGARGPISLGVGADDRDPDENVISLSPPWSFGLPSKQYYHRNDVLDLYKATIGQVLEALMREAPGPSHVLISTFQAPGSVGILNEQLVEALVYFEAQIATASPDPEDLQDITKVYNPRSLDEADAYNPAISVKTLINHFSGGYKPSKIIVASPEYLKELARILSTTDRETLRAYLVWKAVQSYGGLVESDAVEPLRRFNNKLQGKGPDVKPERWRTCVGVVDSDLPWILSRFFVERAFSKEAKDFGDQIIHDIKDDFVIKLRQSEWMTETVRELAIDKVNNIRQKIGYPDIITNAEELQQYYSNVSVHADTFFENRLSATKNDIRDSWAQLGQPVDRDEWGMSAPTVNAYYNPPGNEIVFPAGIMQAPVFYGPSVPKYISYGAFGAVAGHELSHAFDSTGRHYDQNGNYTDWWDESTVDGFASRAECFVQQYHNYTIPGGLPINGKLTLGENIADAGGLTAAFQAWRQRDDEKPDQQLPGLGEFGKEQVFFIAYGMTWCGKIRSEEAIRRVYTDPHSPSAFRILGTTANSREFREAFNCPVKEPTCELW